ncbi:hypothetical protein FQN55_006290 [Onygenales sp. PD_40]|nr:hypothetical protein FQN55_006290 [Onygenales sp. PD_40]KAK2770436.1 hypothetical protein FQN53_005547 [Emmonsiellopsis sp. PD_33]KAK2786682.1 hypothetical protein FQN52_007690 [Onygenales sp. PD_12]KAK2805622.1 hypothetical protein FQN51_009125 [Onygenales sp. PD_10]
MPSKGSSTKKRRTAPKKVSGLTGGPKTTRKPTKKPPDASQKSTKGNNKPTFTELLNMEHEDLMDYIKTNGLDNSVPEKKS